MNASQPSKGKFSGVSLLLILALVALLLFAVGRLFSLRFLRGDIYPPYSSLRADPLGAKVLADVIDELPGFSVERSYRQLSKLKLKQPATIVYLGIDYAAVIDKDEFAEAERLVKSGARLIITFARELADTSATPTAPVPTTAPPPASNPAPGRSRRTFRNIKGELEFHDAAQAWGVSFDRAQKKDRQAMHDVAVPDEHSKGLEPSVPWHTALFFTALDPSWRTLYRSNGESVAIERKFGSGSIVLCTDTFFLSNEGLQTARASKLVAEVIGPPRLVIFDEFHNGVSETQNVAGLARKHGLGGAILSLLGVAALFIWRNSVPFLPPRKTAEEAGGHVVGIDANAGFVNLLRRGVPANHILAVCVDEWRKSRGARMRDEERAHVDSVIRAHEGRSATRDAAAAYRTIAAGLNQR
jgi:Domain of unknown function (DUF4350)